MILSCDHIGKSFGENVILSDISFHISENDKLGIVGINGVGKTTLLRIITGEESYDSGNIFINNNYKIGYLKQNQDISSKRTILEEISIVKEDIFQLEEQIRNMEREMKTLSGKELEAKLADYHRCMSLFEQQDGYSAKSEITGVIKGLGFTDNQFNQTIDTLSGGQKTRVALGKILLSKPELIILDEPTNHLDMNSIAWLETYIANYKGAVLIVSHDRYFLDKTVNSILELDNTKGSIFSGNYSSYVSKKEIIKRSLFKAYENQQREIKHQEEVIAKLKQFNREKSIKRAESREKMLDKVERIDRPSEINAAMNISFNPRIESGNDVISVKGLSKSYANVNLFSEIDFEIKRGERIAILGDNGTGKTTLLKIINEYEQADSGQIKLGAGVHIGYYDQEQQVLDDSNTVFDEIHDAYPDMTQTQIRNVLAAFLFTGDDVFKMIADLSGGEKGRVSLAKLMLSNANFLILDEPTNHLDIISKEILENALVNYTGTVLYVSHDRYFVNKTATGILHLNNNRLDKYIGNYDYFLEKYSERTARLSTSLQESASTSSAPTESKEDWQKQKEEKARLKKIQTQINRIEELVEEYEGQIAAIDEKLLEPENACNSALLASLSNERQEYENKINELMDEWEELQK